jgi:hypothetical protein
MKTLSRIVLAVALALPLAASAQAKAPAASDSAFRVGVGGGYEFGGDDILDSGFGVRIDPEYDVMQLAENLKLGVVLPLSWSRFSDTGVDLDIYRAIPSARFTYAVAPQFGLFADAGVGVAYATATGFDETVLALRGAVGPFYQVSPQFRIGAEFGVNWLNFDAPVDAQTLMNLSGVVSYRF